MNKEESVLAWGGYANCEHIPQVHIQATACDNPKAKMQLNQI